MQRIAVAKRALAEAMEWVPPLTVTREQEVLPDDPRYETAPMGEEYITSEAVFRCATK